jgi:hypothetical protein
VQAGYTSYEAFWIGGASGLAAPFVLQPQPPEGGGSIVGKGGKFAIDFSRKANTREILEIQIAQEDEELLSLIVLLCSRNV